MSVRRSALARLVPALALVALPGCWIYTEDAGDDPVVRAPDAAESPEGGGGGAGGAGDGGATGGTTPPTCPERRETYPEGPYGTRDGRTIANLGFVDPEGAPVDFQSLRADCTYSLAVVTTSAGWCTACREEQPKLQALFDDYRARGLVVIVTLFEDDNYAPATTRLAEGWRDRYDLTLPVLVDAPFALGDYYDRDQTPMTMLVDLETMRIERIMNGYIDADVRSLVDTLL